MGIYIPNWIKSIQHNGPSPKRKTLRSPRNTQRRYILSVYFYIFFLFLFFVFFREWDCPFCCGLSPLEFRLKYGEKERSTFVRYRGSTGRNSFIIYVSENEFRTQHYPNPRCGNTNGQQRNRPTKKKRKTRGFD